MNKVDYYVVIRIMQRNAMALVYWVDSLCFP